MTIHGAAITAVVLMLGSSAELALAEDGVHWTAQPNTRGREGASTTTGDERLELPDDRGIAMRPGALAGLIDTLAGGQVRLIGARVVGVFAPQVFLVESQTPLRPIVERSRVLVLIEAGNLRVDAAHLVASTVTVSGVARTLLGMQVSREVPWPPALTREAIERLEIRAAVLARSVRTPEGVDLLVRSSSGLTPSPSSSGR